MVPWPVPPPGAVVYLNGLPAVGKQTMAQALAGILGADRAVLIDSFAFTDHLDLPPSLSQRKATPSPSPSSSPSSSVAPRTTSTDPSPSAATSWPAGPPVSATLENPRQSSRHRKRSECFARYVENPGCLTRVVIFTDSQPDTPAGAAEARAYEQAAKRAGRPFVPIYVTCKPEENLRRFNSVERRCSHKGRGLRVSPPSSSSSPSAGGPGVSRSAAADRVGGAQLYRFPDYDGLDVNATTQEAHVSAMQILAFIHWCVDGYRGERRDSRLSGDGLSNDDATPVEGREPEWKYLGAR